MNIIDNDKRQGTVPLREIPRGSACRIGDRVMVRGGDDGSGNVIIIDPVTGTLDNPSERLAAYPLEAALVIGPGPHTLSAEQAVVRIRAVLRRTSEREALLLADEVARDIVESLGWRVG